MHPQLRLFILQLFLDFCAFFSPKGPSFFGHHDSPSNLGESRYHPWTYTWRIAQKQIARKSRNSCVPRCGKVGAEGHDDKEKIPIHLKYQSAMEVEEHRTWRLHLFLVCSCRSLCGVIALWGELCLLKIEPGGVLKCFAVCRSGCTALPIHKMSVSECSRLL